MLPLSPRIFQCMRQLFVKRPFLAATFNLCVEQNLVHLGRFLHFSQKVVGVTLSANKLQPEPVRSTINWTAGTDFQTNVLLTRPLCWKTGCEVVCQAISMLSQCYYCQSIYIIVFNRSSATIRNACQYQQGIEN